MCPWYNDATMRAYSAYARARRYTFIKCHAKIIMRKKRFRSICRQESRPTMWRTHAVAKWCSLTYFLLHSLHRIDSCNLVAIKRMQFAVVFYEHTCHFYLSTVCMCVRAFDCERKGKMRKTGKQIRLWIHFIWLRLSLTSHRLGDFVSPLMSNCHKRTANAKRCLSGNGMS